MEIREIHVTAFALTFCRQLEAHCFRSYSRPAPPPRPAPLRLEQMDIRVDTRSTLNVFQVCCDFVNGSS